ncbi:MAG: hypothetical protein B7Y39_18915 [Bdellovibrio sp. 28-41-41]|nr:MAG: hypothetical protein B7Y39_18915 [Bdellovibrio sp. 28-41-41]
MKKSPVSPSFLKQRARQIKKEKSLTQHQALDEAAKELGHSNYKNFLNILDMGQPQPKPATEDQMQALWLDKQKVMTKKLYAVQPLFENFKIPFHDLFNTLNENKNSKDTVQSICEKSALKEYLELYFLIDALRDEEGEIDDYTPYHVAKKASLKNVIYKFKKGKIFVEGEYDLKLEFGFEYDKDDKHPTFQDEEMSGYFELTLDSDKNISIEDMDIGHNF